MALKDESIVQHRFIQIQQTTSLAADKVRRLWQVLGSSDLSTIAISNACDKVVKAVKTSQLELPATIQQLQNLVLTTNEESRRSIFMRSITQLLLWHAVQSPESVPPIETEKHPFVSLLRQRPNLYYDLLVEVDFCLEQCKQSYSDALFYSLAPFYDTVFLMNLGDIDPAALLNCFSNFHGGDK
ncbi:unnamed protein product [Absidia cylindrospora]